MKPIPTAEQLLINSVDSHKYGSDVEECMIEFARLHVEAALKASHSNMQLPDEDLEYTLSSYPPSNIK